MKELEPHKILRQEDEVRLEQQAQDKQEYKLLGSYSVKKGLKLFCLDHKTDEVEELEVRHVSEVEVDFSNTQGYKDKGETEVTVDSRDIHFQALNLKNALKRVQRWREGKIKELNNLNPPPKNNISLTFDI